MARTSGRASTLPAATVRRMVKARAKGLGWTAIAKELNDANVRTGRGGAQWYCRDCGQGRPRSHIARRRVPRRVHRFRLRLLRSAVS
jgi:hypothetical protein